MPCSPGMRLCRPDCLHRRMVHEFHAVAHSQRLGAEHASLGYKTEMAQYLAENPPLTFRQFLEGRRRPEEPEQEEQEAA